MAIWTDTASDLLITLPDVARLTQVQRPVVSMWRRRSAGSDRPFPPPQPGTASPEQFDASAMVDWLEATGRGNNPDPRADLAAFAVPRDIPLAEPAAFAGVTALLALAAVRGALPDDPDELLDLADADDPDDECLYSELGALGDRLVPLVRFVTDLADAAYSPAAAFEQLMGRRFRLSIDGHTTTDVSPQARKLVVAVAAALGTQAELGAARFVDPTAGGSDLIIELARRAAECGSVVVATPKCATSAGRLARRRLFAHGIPWERLREDGQGGFDFPTPAVVVLHLPPVDDPGMPDAAVLRLLNEVALCCTAGQRVVVLGPASALTDRSVDSEVVDLRRDLLRTDLVRAVVRLPYGLLTTQGRRRLAVWCLGPPPGGAAGGSRTLVADIGNTTLGDTTIDALAVDLVAGLEGLQGRAHTLQLARSEPTSTLQLTDGDLAAAAVSVRPPEVPGVTATRLAALLDSLRAPLPDLPEPPVLPRRTALRPAATSVAESLTQGRLSVMPGVRLDDADTTDIPPGLPVLAPPDLRPTSRCIDALVLAARYPASRLTEPGDVVFCTAPRRPAAWVDRDGGSVVAFPARVLRCHDRRLVPDVVAADVNAQPETAKVWRAWTLRYTPEDQSAALSSILDGIVGHRRALTDRVDALDEISALLISGTTGGSLDLNLTKGP